MGGTLVEIRKQHLPNTSPKYYRSSSQLSPMQQRFYWETDICWTLQKIFCYGIRSSISVYTKTPHIIRLFYPLFHFSDPTYSYLAISSVENTHMHKARNIKVIYIYKKKMNCIFRRQKRWVLSTCSEHFGVLQNFIAKAMFSVISPYHTLLRTVNMETAL